MVTKMERQLKWNGSAREVQGLGFFNHGGRVIWRIGLPKPKQIEELRSNYLKGKNVSINTRDKSDTQTYRNHHIKWFLCLGIGHIASKYPNKRAMIL